LKLTDIATIPEKPWAYKLYKFVFLGFIPVLEKKADCCKFVFAQTVNCNVNQKLKQEELGTAPVKNQHAHG